VSAENVLLENGYAALLESGGLVLLETQVTETDGTFYGVGVQTDVRAASGTTVAFFEVGSLVECRATFSPTEIESLTFAVSRTDARAAELTVGRVVRTTFSNALNDAEWDILSIADGNRSDVLYVTAVSIKLRLARAVVTTTNGTTGEVTVDYTGAQLTPTEWVNTVVLPALADAGLSWITLGTVDSTKRFDLSGQWNSALEVVQAIMSEANANGEYRLRRDGDTHYRLDLLNVIGAEDDAVFVRTGTNLDETKRERSLVDVATRLFPRGATDRAETTMANNLWRIKSVPSGTLLELEDFTGGAGPIAYDDQLNGTFLAVMNSTTLTTHEVTASNAATQEVTIADTSGMVAGQWVRFFEGSGVSGARLISLAHPTLSLPPASGGLGDRMQILDRSQINGETNLVENGTQREWTTPANPPNGWGEYSVNTIGGVSFSQETSDTLYPLLPVTRISTSNTSSGVIGRPLLIQNDASVPGALVLTQQPGVYVETPEIPVWKTSTRTYTASVWIKVTDAPFPDEDTFPKIYMYAYDVSRPEFATKPVHPALQAGLIGVWDIVEGSVRGTWLRFESAPFDFTGFVDFGVLATNQYHDDVAKVNGKLRIRVELAGGTLASATNDDVFLYNGYRGVWDSLIAYAEDDVVSSTRSGVQYFHKAVIANNNLDPIDHAGTWLELAQGDGTDFTSQRYSGQNVDSGWDVSVGPVTLSETIGAIGDRDYSGATELWQAANLALPRTSNVVKGYDLTIADLSRDDSAQYATFMFKPGSTIILQDVDLGEVSQLRLLEYSPDYLRPLNSAIRVGQAPDRLTDFTQGLQRDALSSAGTLGQRSLAVGSAGPAGPTGPAGPLGPTGPLGPASTVPGPTGPTGPGGVLGLPGATGPTGPIGIGSTGPTGDPGVVGLPGVTGPTGATGVGATGPSGVPGVIGLPGATGPTGVGVAGPTGPTGFAGVIGLPGATGPAGDVVLILSLEDGGGLLLENDTGKIKLENIPVGPIGATGDPGVLGLPGATGPTGPIGLSVTGPTGTAGVLGLPGVTGPTGPIGLGVTGPTGPGGVLGLPGATGPTGPGGLSVTGSTGPGGVLGLPGVTGPTGPTGLSITGPTGNNGVLGLPGATGPTGAVSTVPGPTGPSGNNGVLGLPGATGPSGPQGPAGAAGPQGIQGPAGAAGPAGPAGAEGPQGAQGPQGPAGEGLPSTVGISDGYILSVSGGVAVWVAPF
jgi:hypothetical protein